MAPGQPGALERMRFDAPFLRCGFTVVGSAKRGPWEPFRNQVGFFLEKGRFLRENLHGSLLLMVVFLRLACVFLMFFGSLIIVELCEWNSAELMFARGGDATAEW